MPEPFKGCADLANAGNDKRRWKIHLRSSKKQVRTSRLTNCYFTARGQMGRAALPRFRPYATSNSTFAGRSTIIGALPASLPVVSTTNTFSAISTPA